MTGLDNLELTGLKIKYELIRKQIIDIYRNYGQEQKATTHVYTEAPFEKPVQRINCKNMHKRKSFNLENDIFTAINSNAFKKFDRLTNLCFEKICIKKLKANCFKGLGSLTKLNITFNGVLTKIEPNAFDGLTSLAEMTMNNCPFTKLESDMFTGLSNVKTLRIRGNRGGVISDREWTNTKAKRRNLFSQFKNLTELTIERTKLTYIDEHFFQGLDQLKSLELRHNPIKRIDATALNGLPKLERVFAFCNHMETVDFQCFSKLPSLKYICLRFNQTKHFVNEGTDSSSFPALEELELQLNSITLLKPNLFKNMGNLKKLNLNSNAIRCIDPNLFIDLIHLKELGLGGNALTEINANMFNGLCELESLFLDTNAISIIRPNSFDTLIKLKKLTLYNNKLSQLDASLFDKFTDGLDELRLDGNELDSKYIQMMYDRVKSASIKTDNKRKRCD